MTEKQPTLEEWRRLYEVWDQFKEVAPWQWMDETKIFGVQDPDSGQLGFVSVMGSLGEHYAIALYLDREGLYGFHALEQAGPEMTPEQVLNVPQLQASFEDRQMLHERDRDLIKQLGLKYRGRQAWPQFRSYRPGFAPWFLEADEVRFLTHALTQAQDVALRFRDNWTLLTRGSHYLVRVARKEKGQLVWQDQSMTVPPPEPASIQLQMDLDALAALRRQPRAGFTLEMDLFMLPSTFRDKGERPYYAYSLLTVDKRSGMILGQELLPPLPSLLDMYSQIPLKVVYLLSKLGSRPKEIRVRSPILYQLLTTLEKELGFKLKSTNQLALLDSVREDMFRFLMR
ncbi:MAG: hypothetical protein HC875_31575 [Anaerolineales bacterium]|nr:hypothetical protein [Anaerolineales bacterium]